MAKSIHVPSVNGGGNPALRKHGNGYERRENKTGENMSEGAKIRRRKFVAHYIKTTNVSASAEFAGFKSPASQGRQLLNEPYVQNLIQEALHAMEVDAIISQQEIMFRFKEEANNQDAGNQAARIAALAHMAKIRGMLIEKQELTVSSGVMVVPMVGSPDEWELLAEKAQEKLKSKVKE